MTNDDVRRRFFAATKRRYQTVDVPLIGEVRIRSLTASEIRVWREAVTTNKDLEYANELLVAAAVVDETGERIFSDTDARGADFGGLDSAAFAVLSKAVRKHTNVEADPDWRAIEEAAKNSEATG